MPDLPHLFYGTTREHYLLLFGVAGVVAMFAGAVSAWIGAYFGGRRAAERLREAQAIQLDRSAAELTALREAVDTMAVEVERIAEGQRFAAKLLTAQADARQVPDAGPRRPLEVITPH